MTTFYNEIDAYAAQWLRNLAAAGHIPRGVVDERSIMDLRPSDLAGFRTAHFFAGISGWERALQLAGWPDDREVWTGSCPCQPFSAAGKRKGTDDERHLWPAFFRLIDACRPATVMGEQVASKDGLAWLDIVSADLEAAGYTVRAADICAAGIGAPHIRQRLWWRADRRVADADRQRHDGFDALLRAEARGRNATGVPEAAGDGGAGGLADADDPGPQGRGEPGCERAAERTAGPSGLAGGLADICDEPRDCGRGAAGVRAELERGRRPLEADRGLPPGHNGGSGPLHGFWRDADWLHCRDGKWRPVEPGSFPLVDGLPAGMVEMRTGNIAHRAGTIKAFGNAIVPQVAAEFIRLTEEEDRP